MTKRSKRRLEARAAAVASRTTCPLERREQVTAYDAMRAAHRLRHDETEAAYLARLRRKTMRFAVSASVRAVALVMTLAFWIAVSDGWVLVEFAEPVIGVQLADFARLVHKWETPGTV